MCRRFEISLPLLSAGNNKGILIQYKSSFQVNLNFFAKLEKPLSNLKNTWCSTIFTPQLTATHVLHVKSNSSKRSECTVTPGWLLFDADQ